MIRAVFFRSRSGEWTGYQARGHADYAEEGQDIVCAAVSVLGATIVNSLEVIAGVVPVMEENDAGVLCFSLPCGLTETQTHDAQTLMRTLYQGLSDVAAAYPNHVQLSIQKWRKHSHDEA